MESASSSFVSAGAADIVAVRAVALLAAGEPGEADLARLREWLAADSANRAAFDHARRAWAASAQVIPASRENRASRSRAFILERRLATVGILALAACMVCIALLPEEVSVRTAPGELTREIFPDGTVAWLDGDTALRLDYTANRRRVSLLHGRAHFAVRDETGRAFEVVAAGAVARDIGTEFSINHTAGGATLTVSEGAVFVEARGGTTTVRAGEATRWREGAAPEQAAAANVDDSDAWRRGRLVFDRVPLEDALAEVSRYRRERLWLIDTDLASRPVSGVIFAARIEQGLDTLAAGVGAQLTRFPFVTLVRAAPAADR